MTHHVLIVEDDETLAGQMADQLRSQGHRSATAHDGRRALQLLTQDVFDVVVLDRMLPGIDGISVLRSMRQANMSLPVLMLTALGQSQQKVEGLDSGADDYIVKPVDTEELSARINALVRGRRWQAGPSDETIRVGDITISPARFSAWRASKLLNLQNIEFKLLLVLARNAESAITRAMLLEQVWNYDFEPATNLVDAHISRLRSKLTEFGGDDPIRTVRNVGYMLRA